MGKVLLVVLSYGLANKKISTTRLCEYIIVIVFNNTSCKPDISTLTPIILITKALARYFTRHHKCLLCHYWTY